MELKRLFETQAKLDEHILMQHNLQYVDLPKVILSLLTELSEVANDWQGFKYWKVNNAQKDTMLEEIADVTHFLASLSNRFKVTKEDIDGLGAVRYTDVSTHFIAMHHAASFVAMYPNANKKREHVLSLWKLFKGLIENLGFTWDEVETAYYIKNETNYARQENGY